MPTLQRAALPAVELPVEEVTVAGLPGSVLVRGLDMPQLLAFGAARRRISEPREGETPEQAADRAGGELVPLLLSMCVVLDDGLPVYSAAQWAAFGARHADSAITLFNAAVRLGGQDVEAEKKP